MDWIGGNWIEVTRPVTPNHWFEGRSEATPEHLQTKPNAGILGWLGERVVSLRGSDIGVLTPLIVSYYLGVALLRGPSAQKTGAVPFDFHLKPIRRGYHQKKTPPS